MEKRCELCGAPMPIDSTRRFCSLSCRGKHNASQQKRAGAVKVCKVCGREFYVFPSDASRRPAEFCSNECRGIGMKGDKNHNHKEKIERICQHCGKRFEAHPVRVKQNRAKFCSKECAAESSRVARFETECAYCGEKMLLTYSRFNAQEKHYCSSECYGKSNIKTQEESERFVVVACEVCGKDFYASKYDAQKGMGKFCSRDCYSIYKSSHADGNYSRARGGKREDLGGLYVRSGWEANWARYLNWLKACGEISGWEYEPETFEFKTIKRGVRFYTPDFRVTFTDGHVEYHEVKGWMDKKSQTKLKRMAKYYPDVPIVLIDRDAYLPVARTMKDVIPNWE